MLSKYSLVVLDNLHRCRLGLACLAQDAVFTGVEQMADVGDVLHVEYVVTAITQVADDDIEVAVCFGMADVRIVVDGRAADVDVDAAFLNRPKCFFLA